MELLVIILGKEKLRIINVFGPMCLILLLSFSSSYGQSTDSIILKLESELFPSDTTKVFLYEYLNEPECYYKIDSTKLIRKYQPDAYVVRDLLKELMYLRDTKVLEKLHLIYQKQIDLFYIEFSQTYLDNGFHAEILSLQLSILSCFEEAIKSLNYIKKGYSLSDIYDKYLDELTLSYKYFREIENRCELAKLFEHISPQYAQLNPCGRPRALFTLDPKDPFKQQLRPYYINSMNNCIFNGSDLTKMSADCQSFILNEEFLHSELDSNVTNFYLNRFDDLISIDRESKAIRYASKYNLPKLDKFIAYKLVHDVPWNTGNQDIHFCRFILEVNQKKWISL